MPSALADGFYKIIEGAAYSLQMFPDEKLENTINSLIDLIYDAQEDDGYQFTTGGLHQTKPTGLFTILKNQKPFQNVEFTG